MEENEGAKEGPASDLGVGNENENNNKQDEVVRTSGDTEDSSAHVPSWRLREESASRREAEKERDSYRIEVGNLTSRLNAMEAKTKTYRLADDEEEGPALRSQVRSMWKDSSDENADKFINLVDMVAEKRTRKALQQVESLMESKLSGVRKHTVMSVLQGDFPEFREGTEFYAAAMAHAKTVADPFAVSNETQQLNLLRLGCRLAAKGGSVDKANGKDRLRAVGGGGNGGASPNAPVKVSLSWIRSLPHDEYFKHEDRIRAALNSGDYTRD